MSGVAGDEWTYFLRKMISHNLGLFEKAGGDGERQQRLDQLKCWNSAQTGLSNMLKLGTNMKQVETEKKGRLMFEDEIRALGDDEVVDEFETYFSSLVGDVEKNNDKYATAMAQLEELLELERETARIKRKVADFQLDYDDDLAKEEVSVDKLFSSSSGNLMTQLQNIQVKKDEQMERLKKVYGKHFEDIDPITMEELNPFLEAVLDITS